MSGAPKKPIKIQIITLGDHTVGKSSILRRYSDGTFSMDTQTTIGIDFVVKKISIGDTNVQVKLWDTAGQDRFHTITQSFYKKCQGVLVVFDVGSKKSFDNIKKWMAQIQNNADANIDKYLIGNKIDTEHREVASEEASKMAKDCKMTYMETSAKINVNVTEAITGLVKTIYTRLNGGEEEVGVKLNGGIEGINKCC